MSRPRRPATVAAGRPATAGTGDVDTGAPATGALFLSGEQFVCADDVVVVGDEDEPGPPTPESTMGKTPTQVYVSYQ